MTEANHFSPKNIIETQRKLVESWFDLAQKNMNGNDQKLDNAPENFPDSWQGFVSRMTQAGNNYFGMANNFSEISKEGGTIQQACANWIDQMSKGFSNMMTQSAPNLNDITKNPSAFWDMPQDTCNRAFSTLFPFPGDFFRAFRPEGLNRMPGDIHGHLDQFLSIPSVGYTRESQDKYKNYINLIFDYQKELHVYNTAMSKVGMEALSVFQTRLLNTENNEETPASFKAIYDLGTTVAEEIYGAYVITDEYSEIYGRVVNSMMAVKRQTAKMADEMFEAFNLPTRKEINTLQKRVQDMHRTYDIKILDEIENLKTQIEQLQNKKNPPSKELNKKQASKTPPKKSNKKIAQKKNLKKKGK